MKMDWKFKVLDIVSTHSFYKWMSINEKINWKSCIVKNPLKFKLINSLRLKLN